MDDEASPAFLLPPPAIQGIRKGSKVAANLSKMDSRSMARCKLQSSDGTAKRPRHVGRGLIGILMLAPAAATGRKGRLEVDALIADPSDTSMHWNNGAICRLHSRVPQSRCAPACGTRHSG